VSDQSPRSNAYRELPALHCLRLTAEWYAGTSTVVTLPREAKTLDLQYTRIEKGQPVSSGLHADLTTFRCTSRPPQLIHNEPRVVFGHRLCGKLDYFWEYCNLTNTQWTPFPVPIQKALSSWLSDIKEHDRAHLQRMQTANLHSGYTPAPSLRRSLRSSNRSLRSTTEKREPMYEYHIEQPLVDIHYASSHVLSLASPFMKLTTWRGGVAEARSVRFSTLYIDEEYSVQVHSAYDGWIPLPLIRRRLAEAVRLNQVKTTNFDAHCACPLAYRAVHCNTKLALSDTVVDAAQALPVYPPSPRVVLDVKSVEVFQQPPWRVNCAATVSIQPAPSPESALCESLFSGQLMAPINDEDELSLDALVLGGTHPLHEDELPVNGRYLRRLLPRPGPIVQPATRRIQRLAHRAIEAVRDASDAKALPRPLSVSSDRNNVRGTTHVRGHLGGGMKLALTPSKFSLANIGAEGLLAISQEAEPTGTGPLRITNSRSDRKVALLKNTPLADAANMKPPRAVVISDIPM